MPLPRDPQPALGRAIRQLREEAGQTQEDLAHEARATTTSIARIEVGARNPTWSMVKRIAAGLGRTVAEVATLAEELERHEALAAHSANARGDSHRP